MNDLFEMMKQITLGHCAAMGYPRKENARDAEMGGWRCLACGRTFDRELVYHYPPPGFERGYSKMPLADPGCKGKMVKL